MKPCLFEEQQRHDDKNIDFVIFKAYRKERTKNKGWYRKGKKTMWLTEKNTCCRCFASKPRVERKINIMKGKNRTEDIFEVISEGVSVDRK